MFCFDYCFVNCIKLYTKNCHLFQCFFQSPDRRMEGDHEEVCFTGGECSCVSDSAKAELPLSEAELHLRVCWPRDQVMMMMMMMMMTA